MYPENIRKGDFVVITTKHPTVEYAARGIVVEAITSPAEDYSVAALPFAPIVEAITEDGQRVDLTADNVSVSVLGVVDPAEWKVR